MKKAEKEATEKLRRLINSNCPDCQVSISYSGKKPGTDELAEVERFSKQFHPGAGKRPDVIY